jgi:hypothetical protein
MCTGKMRARLTRWTAAALLVVASACTQEPPPNPYPADLVENFMAGCQRRSSESICECALGRIQRRWTADEFRRLDETMGDQAAAQIAETVAPCAGR